MIVKKNEYIYFGMLKALHLKISGLVLAGIFFLISSLCAEQYDYIDITDPFLRKIPIAIPFFKTFTGSQTEAKISVSASDLLSDSLEFTGYFKILDRKAFLEDPREAGITELVVKFPNWTSIGAELLITGGVLIDENKDNRIVEMELRLYDTFKMRLLLGKRYKGWANDQRRIIRRFCSEVILLLTGNKGIFDSKIAFVSTGTGNKEIFTCEYDGYNPEQFTKNKSITLFPSWSSDGKWMAYTTFKNGNPDIHIRHISQNRGFIVAEKGINITPAWMPGELKLAATLSFSGDQEIYLLNGSGKILKKLTDNKGIDSSPSWSPDGSKMAFVSRRSGTPQIYITDFISNNVKRLTFNSPYNTQPCWSPKGDKITYSSMENGLIDIYVIGVDGKNLVRLTYNSGNNESPTWSPDGSLIAFSSTRQGPPRIYVMTSSGTDQRRLLTLPGEQTNPKWSPGVINY
jgi:TolB protein